MRDGPPSGNGKRAKDMEFFYSSHYQGIQKIIDSELFSKLILFLKKQQKPPILRELKQNFPEKNFEKILDQLIDAGIITRKDRRYQVAFPIYSTKDQQKSRERWQQPNTIILEELAFILQADIMSDQRFFYACEEGVVQAFIYRLIHESFQLISFSKEKWPAKIPAFFAANRQQLSLPIYQELLHLLGDVDEAYYLDQISVIFERVAKQRKIRPSIFLTSLIEGNILQSEQRFDLPIVEAAFLTEQNGSLMKGLSEFDRRTLLADYLGKTSNPQTILITEMIKF